MSAVRSLWTPQGARPLTRETVELPWGVMKSFITFGDLAHRQQLGVHCSRCDGDVVGSNGEHDPVLKLACGCREFWSVNPGAGRA